MKAISFIITVMAIAVFLAPFKTTAGSNELIERLKAGGHILMVRHALAPGNGDPLNFKIGDCSTQRNLDKTGRVQARKIGDWLRARGVSSARVYSSQWCRCLETAKLIDLGPVQELPALNSFYERNHDREPNLSALNDFISRQSMRGKLIVLVTHFVTIAAITDESVSSGEGVLLEIQEATPHKIVSRLKF